MTTHSLLETQECINISLTTPTPLRIRHKFQGGLMYLVGRAPSRCKLCGMTTDDFLSRGFSEWCQAIQEPQHKKRLS